MPKAPNPGEIRAQVKANLDAVRETIARTNIVLDQVRKVLHELDDSRQLPGAIAERKAEQRRQTSSNQPPKPVALNKQTSPRQMS